MNTAYFYLTDEGKELALRLSSAHPGDLYGKENFKEKLREAFGKYDYLVCIMATGIVVRILAPLIDKKTSDPGVVVLDQRGRHAISLLSGHLGGANDLAREMAAICGGDPVITTATDVAGELSFDSFAKKYHMAIENIGQLKHVSGALLAGEKILVICRSERVSRYPELKRGVEEGKMAQISFTDKMHFGNQMDFSIQSSGNSQAVEQDAVKNKDFPDILDHDALDSGALDFAISQFSASVVIDEKITLEKLPQAITEHPVLFLRPRTICAGIGCKRNMEGAPIKAALLQVLEEEGISPLALKCISTIPLKADEPGIISTAEELNTPLVIIPKEDIEALDISSLGIATSGFVAEKTGVLSVSTASSYLAAGKGTILRDKVKFKGITIALSQAADFD